MKKIILAFIAVASILYACQKTELKVTDRINTDPDISEARDLSAMLQPASDDYASIPQDPKNPLTAEKVALGKLLFHETRLGVSSMQVEGLHTYSCATCHHAEAGFQSGLAQGISEGGEGFGIAGETRMPSALYNIANIDVQPIRSPSVLNSAYSEVVLWNGELGSTGVNIGTEYAWTNDANKNNFLGYQGLETVSIAAQSKHRLIPDTLWLASDSTYKAIFDLAFPELPDTARITSLTVALSLAAYQRTLLANESPFQRWLRGDTKAMTKDEKDGKALFFGKAKCSKCHTGPALNSMQFLAIGMNDMQNDVNGAFNVSPNNRESKGRGGFTNKNADMFKFKVPQLYNLRDVKFLGHGGSFSSVEDVIRYKNLAIPQNLNVPVTKLSKQFVPLLLTESEIDKLVKFVRDALYDPNLSRYVPAAVPSGNCIPNNDIQSRIDRGCQ